MKYRPTALVLGFAITIVSIILFAVLIIFEKIFVMCLQRITSYADGDDTGDENELIYEIDENDESDFIDDIDAQEESAEKHQHNSEEDIE